MHTLYFYNHSRCYCCWLHKKNPQKNNPIHLHNPSHLLAAESNDMDVKRTLFACIFTPSKRVKAWSCNSFHPSHPFMFEYICCYVYFLISESKTYSTFVWSVDFTVWPIWYGTVLRHFAINSEKTLNNKIMRSSDLDLLQTYLLGHISWPVLIKPDTDRKFMHD